MSLRDEILNELREIAPRVALLEKTNPYKLPEGYFVNFNKVLFERLKAEVAAVELNVIAPELSKLEMDAAADIPAEYFTYFSVLLVQKIRAQEALNELTEIAPELSKVEKVNVFAVPAHYFSAFPGKVLNRAMQPQNMAAPVPNWLHWLNEKLELAIDRVFKPKYTFALAGITTTLIIGVMMFMKVNQCNDLDCKFAQLSTEEINTYLDNKSDAYSDEIFEMNLDEKTLPALDNKEGTLGVYKDALKDVDDASLNAAISD